MDRNTIIGLVLIVGILIIFTVFNQPTEEQKRAREEQIKRMRDSMELVKTKKVQEAQQIASEILNNQPTIASKDSIQNDSVKNETNKALFGNFSNSAEGKNSFITLENDKIKITFSSKGGKPYSVELKEFRRYDSTKVILFDGEENIFGLNFYSQNRNISTDQLFFSSISKDSVITIKEGDTSKSVIMRLKAGVNSYLEYVYSLEPNEYMLKFKINFVGMKDIISSTTNSIDLKWQIDVPQQEKGKDWETNNSTIIWKFHQDEVDKLSESSDKEEMSLTTRIKWIAFKQQFFSSILIADNYLSNAFVKYEKNLTSDKYIKNFKAEMTFPYETRDTLSIPLKLYYGPNKYKILSSYDIDLERVIFLGMAIFRWVNIFVIIPLFDFLGSFISNFGIVILILTFIIKIGLFPLTYKSYLSTAKMRVLKPQVDELNKKFPKSEDAMKKQQATMALYKKVGVNPLGGCLPMLLQMPILIAIFQFFPSSIELRHKSFLWANDLSSYDSIFNLPFTIPWYGDHISLFCLLMAGSIILTTKFNTGDLNTGSTQQMPGMKFMIYLMPVMMLLWFNNYSSGLSYYYLVSNIISFLQTIIIRRFVDDEAVLSKLEANKAKPVKKSSFQARLEQMAKQRKLPTSGKK